MSSLKINAFNKVAVISITNLTLISKCTTLQELLTDQINLHNKMT